MRRILELIPVLLLAGLVGCQTMSEIGGGASPQGQATQSLSDSKRLTDQVRAQIDRTQHSLESLMRAPPGEIRNSQQRFASNVDELSSLASQLDQSASQLRQQRIDYLTNWERTQFDVQDSKLKQAAQQRQQRVTSTLADAETSLREARQAVTPLLADFEDVKNVTSNDPTPAGIAAVKKSGILQNTQQTASAANRRLDQAATRFDRALAALAPEPGTRPVGAAGATPRNK